MSVPFDHIFFNERCDCYGYFLKTEQTLMNILFSVFIMKFFDFICRVEVECFRRRGLYSSTCGWRTYMSTGCIGEYLAFPYVPVSWPATFHT